MKKLSAALLSLCLLLSLAACGETAASPAPAASASPSPVVSANTVSAKLSREHANISLTLPDGWSYCETDEESRLGLTFWPEADPAVTAGVWFYTESFGMCGTGVDFEEVTLPGGGKATRATSQSGSSQMYTLIYKGTAGSYVGECFLSGADWDKYGASIASIFESAAVGQGNMTESEAVDAALKACPMDCDSDKTRSDFDYLTGVWEVSLSSSDGKTLHTVTLDPAGTAAVVRDEK